MSNDQRVIIRKYNILVITQANHIIKWKYYNIVARERTGIEEEWEKLLLIYGVRIIQKSTE